MLYKLYDPQHQGIMGPRYESIFRNCALAVMADPAGSTFVDIPKLFRDPEFLKQKLTHVKDPHVLDYWQKEYPASLRSNDAGEVVSWFVSKFGAFLSNEMMRNIIGQTKSAFDLRDIMDNKKILLVNLSKGRTGELNSKLLGMVFVMKFQAAAMSRSDVPEDQRKDFALYVDEFQNFSTDSFATIMSEARKYHLNLIVANQFTTQLTEEIRDAVFGNIGTIVSFRIGQNDVESLSRYFQPQFDGDDILRIPNANTIVRTLINGVPTQPFSMATLPPLGNPNPGLANALKQLSAAKYGKPRAQVEKEIFDRLATKEPEPKPFANPFSAAPGGTPGGFGTPAAAPSPAPTASGSFLDEWLAKQKAPSPSPRPLANPATAPIPPTSGAMPAGANENAGIDTAPSLTVPAPTAETTTEDTKPAASPASAEPQYEAGNVSSAQLDQQEVKDIAAELKKSLKPQETELQIPREKQDNLTQATPQAEKLEEDTIYIDADGVMHQKNPVDADD